MYFGIQDVSKCPIYLLTDQVGLRIPTRSLHMLNDKHREYQLETMSNKFTTSVVYAMHLARISCKPSLFKIDDSIA